MKNDFMVLQSFIEVVVRHNAFSYKFVKDKVMKDVEVSMFMSSMNLRRFCNLMGIKTCLCSCDSLLTYLEISLKVMVTTFFWLAIVG